MTQQSVTGQGQARLPTVDRTARSGRPTTGQGRGQGRRAAGGRQQDKDKDKEGALQANGALRERVVGKY